MLKSSDYIRPQNENIKNCADLFQKYHLKSYEAKETTIEKCLTVLHFNKCFYISKLKLETINILEMYSC